MALDVPHWHSNTNIPLPAPIDSLVRFPSSLLASTLHRPPIGDMTKRTKLLTLLGSFRCTAIPCNYNSQSSSNSCPTTISSKSRNRQISKRCVRLLQKRRNANDTLATAQQKLQEDTKSEQMKHASYLLRYVRLTNIKKKEVKEKKEAPSFAINSLSCKLGATPATKTGTSECNKSTQIRLSPKAFPTMSGMLLLTSSLTRIDRMVSKASVIFLSTYAPYFSTEQQKALDVAGAHILKGFQAYFGKHEVFSLATRLRV